MPASKLAESTAWKPIFGSMHAISWNWHPPGETEEQRQKGMTRDIDTMNADNERQTARRARQMEYLREIKTKLEERKNEL